MKSKKLVVWGKGRPRVKLPKSFMKGSDLSGSEMNFDYNPKTGIGVVTFHSLARQLASNVIKDLVDGDLNNKSYAELQSASKELFTSIGARMYNKDHGATEIEMLDAAVANITLTEEGQEAIYNAVKTILRTFVDIINKSDDPVNIIGALTSTVENWEAISEQFKRLEEIKKEAEETVKNADENKEPNWNKFFERHPELSDVDPYEYVDKNNEDAISVYANVAFRRDIYTTIGNIKPGETFMINGNLYIKHIGGAVRSITTGESLIDELVKANYNGIADVAKTRRPKVSSEFECTRVFVNGYNTYDLPRGSKTGVTKEYWRLNGADDSFTGETSKLVEVEGDEGYYRYVLEERTDTPESVENELNDETPEKECDSCKCCENSCSAACMDD